ncbi:MAG: zinc transport system ATP-binding protein [Clostridiales bacterium]|nr:zinc transport system ATP-binding protein [Clostridiales bacterium]
MITIEDLSFSYQGSNSYLLSDINVSIKSGEYISVIGENGCGKSTLMKLLLGFLKPTKGKIHLDTSFIGYVPQKNEDTNSGFPITVQEVLSSYGKLLKRRDKAEIEMVLTLVGMTDYRHALMGNLSGGQTQKIRIARALLGTPALLILDEPSTGIDIDSQREIYRLLKSLNNEKNMTIVAVEHNLEAAFSNSDKLFHLQNGKGHLCNPDKYKNEYFRFDRKE